MRGQPNYLGSLTKMTQVQKAKLSGTKLLLVDDDPIFCETAKDVLVAAGSDVSIARDGAEALEFLEEHPCDLAIVDLIMPNVDGLRLLSVLRHTQATRKLPVVVVTSRRDQRARDDAERLGVALFLNKPIQWTDLAEQVHDIVVKTADVPEISEAV